MCMHTHAHTRAMQCQLTHTLCSVSSHTFIHTLTHTCTHTHKHKYAHMHTHLHMHRMAVGLKQEQGREELCG